MNSTFQIGETLWLRNPSLAGTAHAEVAVNFRGRVDSAHSTVSPVQPGIDFDVQTSYLSRAQGNEAGPGRRVEPQAAPKADLLVEVNAIIDTAVLGASAAEGQVEFFRAIERQARDARATMVAEVDLLPPNDDGTLDWLADRANDPHAWIEDDGTQH
jgi:hypothetical protein